MLIMANRTFLASHAWALLCIAPDPEVRLRDIAASRGITERSAYGTVTDPAGPGRVRGQMQDQTPQPLPGPGTPAAAEPGSQERIAGDVLALLADTDARV